MELETPFNINKFGRKIYKEREIWAATLLGGTLAAGYMVAANYKAFGENEKARNSWIVTIAGTIFIFYAAFFAPYFDRIPNSVFTLTIAAFIFFLVRVYQGEKIDGHIRTGGLIQSWWKTLGVALISGCLTISISLGITYSLGGFEESPIVVSKTYGTTKHEIYYEQNNISESEVDAIAKALTERIFFDNRLKWFVYARKVENNYEISISIAESSLSDPQLLSYFTNLRNDIQSFFPNNKVIINLVSGDFNKIEKRVE